MHWFCELHFIQPWKIVFFCILCKSSSSQRIQQPLPNILSSKLGSKCRFLGKYWFPPWRIGENDKKWLGSNKFTHFPRCSWVCSSTPPTNSVATSLPQKAQTKIHNVFTGHITMMGRIDTLQHFQHLQAPLYTHPPLERPAVDKVFTKPPSPLDSSRSSYLFYADIVLSKPRLFIPGSATWSCPIPNKVLFLRRYKREVIN